MVRTLLPGIAVLLAGCGGTTAAGVTDIEAGDQRAELIISDDELRSLVPTPRPGLIEIDDDTDAIDDEACYSVFMFEDLTTPPPESTSSDLPAAGELPQLPPSGTWPVTLQGPLPCDEDTVREAGFVIGEVFYGIGCTRVLDEFVTDEAITDGSDAVHVIGCVDPLAPVAQRGPAQTCDEFDEVPEGLAWHMAFGPKGLAGEVICRVGDLDEQQARANGC